MREEGSSGDYAESALVRVEGVPSSQEADDCGEGEEATDEEAGMTTKPEVGVIGLNEHRLRMAEAVQAAIEQERERCAKIAAYFMRPEYITAIRNVGTHIERKIREGA